MSATRARYLVLIPVLLALMACGLASPTPRSGGETQAEPVPTVRASSPTRALPATTAPQAPTPDTIAEEFLALANGVRAEHGLPPLARDPWLDDLARQYAASSLSDAALETSDLRYLVTNSWWTSYHGGTPRLDDETASEQLAYCLGEERMREALLLPEGRATGLGVATQGDTVYFTQAFDVLATRGGDGEMITLQDNDGAKNPDWDTLLQFLAADDTDAQAYVDGEFVCGDFAEMLHNQAEAAGIRTGYVAVDLGEGPGHALNAFDLDGRLVFVDAIGGDKVACLEVGRPLGVMSLEAAERYSCDRFDEYSALVSDYLAQSDAYGRSVRSYNDEIGEYDAAVKAHNQHPSDSEYDRLSTWAARLDQLAAELDAWNGQLKRLGEDLGLSEIYWDPTGSLVGAGDATVTDFYVHW